MSTRLIAPLAALQPALIIFDKDGTLLDFQAMWGPWLIDLVDRLEAVVDRPLADPIFTALGFDSESGDIKSDGALAVAPLAELRRMLADLLRTAGGLSTPLALAALASAWKPPDPVGRAQPLTDLAHLFSTLQAAGSRIAIATSDDRALTEATLHNLGLEAMVEAIVCADDGLPIKPAPDMVLSLCHQLDSPPAKTVMVGDNVADLKMGRAAGAGLVIGVLSGVSPPEVLAPQADLLLPTVADLVEA